MNFITQQGQQKSGTRPFLWHCELFTRFISEDLNLMKKMLMLVFHPCAGNYIGDIVAQWFVILQKGLGFRLKDSFLCVQSASFWVVFLQVSDLSLKYEQ